MAKTPSKRKASAKRAPDTTVTRLRREGGRIVKGIERDVRHLIRRARSELTGNATVLRREVEARVTAAERALWARVGAASTRDTAALRQQIASAVRRLEVLERKVDGLVEDLHDQVAPERD